MDIYHMQSTENKIWPLQQGKNLAVPPSNKKDSLEKVILLDLATGIRGDSWLNSQCTCQLIKDKSLVSVSSRSMIHQFFQDLQRKIKTENLALVMADKREILVFLVGDQYEEEMNDLLKSVGAQLFRANLSEYNGEICGLVFNATYGITGNKN